LNFIWITFNIYTLICICLSICSSRETKIFMATIRRLIGMLVLAAPICVPLAVANADSIDAPIPNCQPLKATPFVRLPLGSVRADGWLLTELRLQRDGLTGHAEQVIPDLGPDSAWLGGTGKNAEDWEKGPYYVKGLVTLAYALDDESLKQKAHKWIEWSLKSQRADGSFGPLSNDDWWPRMVMTYALRQYAEASGDPRVLPMLQRYLRYMLGELPHRPLKDWGKSRAGDQIDTAFWVYNRTGDPAMLKVAQLLHAQAYDWTDIYTHNRFMQFGSDFQPRHGVNVAQAMKMPPLWYQISGTDADCDAFQIGLGHLMRETTLPLDVLTGTEMLSGRSPIQGVETCAIVEQMLSDETALAILGDGSIADALERTAYNALPGAMTKDLKLYQYYTPTNNVMAVRGGHGFDQDYADGMLPGPVSGYPCCCYNLHMGWPMLVQNAWMATNDGGLAPVIYAPTVVRTHLPQAGDVTITEETNYPFDGDVHLKLSLARPAAFPLKVRIPGWCTDPTMIVNGKPEAAPRAGTFAILNRSWLDGDQVDLSLPMPVTAIRGVNNSISLARGPLVFSLKMAQEQKPQKPDTEGFVQLEITSPDPWNLALNVDPDHPSKSIGVSVFPMPPGSPFQSDTSPVRLSVSGKRVPSWRMNWTGRIAEDPPVSPVSSDQPDETVTLVPFGAQTLRVTAFPWLGPPATSRSEYRCDFHDTDAPGWVMYGGSWDVESGRWCAPAEAGTAGVKAIATETDFADFTYEADVTPAGTGYTGLVFRVTRPSIGDNAFNGYYVGLFPHNAEIVLGKCGANDNSWTVLARTKLSVQPGVPIHLRVVAAGSHISVFAGGGVNPVLDATDHSFARGAIGVRRYSATSNSVRAGFAHLWVTSAGFTRP
jgi:hypothetical protein